ncbi:hypothetical protein [Thalassobius sp. Cn5-15]|nr:hypothetical protein [Thalassobius sp. Cn5-15]
MRFLPIVLGWAIAATALSAIASLPGAPQDISEIPAVIKAG